MNLAHYRLLTQLGAARDGVSYRAEDTARGVSAEVRVLSGARADGERWELVARRLRRAAMIDHAGAVRIQELRLDHDPPFVALECVEGPSLATLWRQRVPAPKAEVALPILTVAAALAAAHRVGLAHGGLCPGAARKTGPNDWKLDFTGLDVSPEGPVSDPEIDGPCLAPEVRPGGASHPEADIYALGAMLFWLLEGRPPRPGSEARLAGPLEPLVRSMLAADPDERPSAREALAALVPFLQPSTAEEAPRAALTIDHTSRFSPETAETLDAPSPDWPTRERSGQGPTIEPETVVRLAAKGRLGRFALREVLGQGGMGAVFRAEDEADGTPVAIKVLRYEWGSRPDSLRRFHKEARLLGEVNNPYVTNLLEVNEDDGIHYLVLEYVAGRSLGSLLAERGKLDEPLALAILADVARALVLAHERGIVHRDIKPDNILLVETPTATDGPASIAQVKLSDFGLARHVVESESLMVTQAEAVVGTPAYMAPEQGTGGVVDPRADVYAMGTTLYHMLAGRPPFSATRLIDLIAMHQNEPPPSLRKLNPEVSDGACQVVEKTLAKSPDTRYVNAEALLQDLERLLRGEPTGIAVHPRLPSSDPREVLEFDFRWELESSPRQLWPHVSNTERLNRAIGLPAVKFTPETDPDRGASHTAEARLGGLPATWEEHPFEWVEPRRFGVLRVYSRGPFQWFVSIVEMTPRLGGGTTLVHRIRVVPRNLLLRPVVAMQMNGTARRSLERVYRRIDAALTGKLGDRVLVDPFEETAELPAPRRRRLDQLLDTLIERGVHPSVVERLGDFLAQAPPQEVARIRPLALARRLGLDPDGVVAACLHGVREGLLVLLWDLLCPVCRIPSEVKDTLRSLRDHGHCEACNLDYDLDFANSVEMIFRAHPDIRDAELGTYCIGGPAHSPHVVAQVRVAPSERMVLDLALPEGTYRLRGPQLPFAADFRVGPSAIARRGELRLAARPGPDFPPAYRPDAQVFTLTNDSPAELVVRVERTAPRDDALTAARASALGLFRELFPGEVLAPGQLVSIAHLTLLVTDLAGAEDIYGALGDARAFGLIHEHFRRLDERIRREGGALVKTIGEGAVAAFGDPSAAVRTALDLLATLDPRELEAGLRLRAAIHRGAAMVATLNDHLDYFGATVNQATALPRLARGGELILGGAVASDPSVVALLQARGLHGVILPEAGPGGLVHRVAIPEAPLATLHE